VDRDGGEILKIKADDVGNWYTFYVPEEDNLVGFLAA